MERRLPRIRVRSRQLHSLIGQRLVLQIDSWDRTSNYPNGHIVRVLGPCNDLKCAAESADGKVEPSGSDLHQDSPPGALSSLLDRIVIAALCFWGTSALGVIHAIQTSGWAGRAAYHNKDP